MDKKAIEIQPDRRYLFRNKNEYLVERFWSGSVIEMTDHHVRLKNDITGRDSWFSLSKFSHKYDFEPDKGEVEIMEELEPIEAPRAPRGRHKIS